MRLPGVLLTLEELVRVGLRCVPPTLVAPSVRLNLLQARLRMPACFSFGAFELRLDGDPRIDVLACATREDGGRDVLARSRRRRHSSNRDTLTELLNLWRETETSRGIEALWVELDRVVGARRQAPPFGFLRFGQTAGTIDVLHASAAFSIDAATRNSLLTVLSILAPSERVLHLAAPRHRGKPASSIASTTALAPLRVHVGLTPARVSTVVRALGLPGDMEVIDTWLEAWPAGRQLGVQFDVCGDSPPDFVDLEFYLGSAPVDDVRWSRMLDRCTRRAPNVKRETLALISQWPSRGSVSPDGELWPLTIQRELQLKVRLAPRGPANLKAYLGFSPRLAV